MSLLAALSDVLGKLVLPFQIDTSLPSITLGLTRVGKADFQLTIYNPEQRPSTFWLHCRLIVPLYDGETRIDWLQHITLTQNIRKTIHLEASAIPQKLVVAPHPTVGANEIPELRYVAWYSTARGSSLAIKGRLLFSAKLPKVGVLLQFLSVVFKRRLVAYLLSIFLIFGIFYARKLLGS